MSRIAVQKTYKLYIGGKFPRTESGRYYTPENPKGELLGNVCLGSRKDFRNAVVAARGAFGGWAGRAAFNRGQILYRLAEMLEGRSAQFVEELVFQGSTAKEAKEEVALSIDRLVYYAGWCDKYQQVFSAVNPVASNHFNFSLQEPTGVVVVVAPEESSLLGLISTIAPAIAGGNAVIVLASESKPLCSITFAEVVHTSDVPGGVVNVLTGKSAELLSYFASHMDVNAVVYARTDEEEMKLLQTEAAGNVKRVALIGGRNWKDADQQDPYLILNTQEVKTTWHPMENIAGPSGGY